MNGKTLDAAEQAIADRTWALSVPLLAEPYYANVWYDEDGDGGWHITIEAGEERYRETVGATREFVLTYWTRSDSWLWETTDENGRHSGPWDHQLLAGDASVEDVVAVVRAEVGP